MRNPRRGTEARRRAILDAVNNGDVSTLELSRQFGVTESTIRRDLRQMAADGKVSRTYGGITVSRSTTEFDALQKGRRHPAEKQGIAEIAARYVEPGDVIILDSGTTTGALAKRVRSIGGLTVITSGMNALMELHDAPEVELIVLGGRLRHINQGMVGNLAEYGLGFVKAHKAFLGAEGLDASLGISCPTLELAVLKTKMMDSAEEVYVLADSSKLGQKPFGFWAPWPDDVTLITDTEHEEFTASFHRRSGHQTLAWRSAEPAIEGATLIGETVQ